MSGVTEGPNEPSPAQPELDGRKDRIFRKVGRNVVNLQRLEKRLKALLSIYVDAPLGKLPEALKKRRDALARQTMGPLTHEMIDRLIPETSPQGAFELLATEVWVIVSLGLEGNENLRLELRTNLKRLVDDRNELVHHMFGGFDPRSEESCAQLERKLDAQRSHITEVFRWIEDLSGLIPEHVDGFETQLQGSTAVDTKDPH